MTRKHTGKRIGSVLIAVIMATITLPQLSTEVCGTDTPDESEKLDKTLFATVEDLKTFNTAGDTSSAKVYFGSRGDRNWWIAGSQSPDSLTLLYDYVMLYNQNFATGGYPAVEYDEEWGCVYPYGAPEEVNSCHYGRSLVREKLQEEFEGNNIFTDGEKLMMRRSTIYTWDCLNEEPYYTRDYLYAPYVTPNDTVFFKDDPNAKITVGENSMDDLSGGLPVFTGHTSHFGNKYLGSNKWWFRAPYGGWMALEYAATPSPRTKFEEVWDAAGHYVKPAFKLSLSTVTFASAAPAATQEGKMTFANANGNGDGAFTLRYLSSTDRWMAEVSNDGEKVTITNTPETGAYLVVQDSEGAYAKQVPAVEGEVKITAEDMKKMGMEADNFNACEVWLEKTDTDNRITYAMRAAQGPGYNVNISAGTGLAISSNNGSQPVNLNNHINEITVTVNEGYSLPEDYITELNESIKLKGLTVTETDNGFTISGIPYGNIDFTLPAATFIIDPPTDLTAVYGDTLSDIELPVGWTWKDENTPVSVGEQKYPAHFDVSSYIEEYVFSNVDGYNETGKYVERNLTVYVDKAYSTLEIATESLNKEYDGKAVEAPEIAKEGSTGDVSFTWCKKKEDDGKEDNLPDGYEKISSAPTDAGEYLVIASVEDDDNYKGADAGLPFTISQAANEWTQELSIKGWRQGDGANAPTAAAKFGDVSFAYSDSKDGEYTDTVPTDAGTWYVKAAVTSSKNYTGLEAVKAFEIKEALPGGSSGDGDNDSGSGSAPTGDDIDIALWAGLAGFAALGAAAAALFGRKKKMR